MKNILLAALLGALVAFIWGALSWAVLPFHMMSMHKMKNEDQMIEMMKQNISKTRVYAFPGWDENAPDKKAQEQAVGQKFRTGPSGWVFYHAEGRELMDPKQYISGFLIAFIGASLAAFALALAADKLPRYFHRVLFVMMIGLFAAVETDLTYWNWMWFPTKWSLLFMSDHVITWFLAGLLIAWRIKPAKT